MPPHPEDAMYTELVVVLEARTADVVYGQLVAPGEQFTVTIERATFDEALDHAHVLGNILGIVSVRAVEEAWEASL